MVSLTRLEVLQMMPELTPGRQPGWSAFWHNIHWLSRESVTDTMGIFPKKGSLTLVQVFSAWIATLWPYERRGCGRGCLSCNDHGMLAGLGMEVSLDY